MPNASPPAYSRPAVFSYGFRDFFLIAGLFAVLIVPLWMIVWSGRLAVAGAFGLAPVEVLVLDCAFMAGVLTIVLREVIAGLNWNNLNVAVPVMVYLAADLTFHLEAMWRVEADVGRRLGLAMIVMLILLIRGRIIPNFTRN